MDQLDKFLGFDITSQYYLSLSVGLAGVIIYCLANFNQKVEEYYSSDFVNKLLPRDLTSSKQYNVGFIVYIVGLSAGYVVICLLGPGPGYRILSAMAGGALDQRTVAENFPIYLALVLLGLVPNFDRVNVIERRFRGAIHRQISIPRALRALAMRMENDRIEPAVEGLPVGLPDDRCFDPVFIQKWTRTAILMGKWRRHEELLADYINPDFVDRHQKIVRELDREYNALDVLVTQRSDLLTAANTRPGEEYFEHVRAFHSRLCEFIAAAILRRCGLSTRRYEALQRLGYASEELPREGRIFVLAAGLAGILFFAVILANLGEQHSFMTVFLGWFGLSGAAVTRLGSTFIIAPFLLRQFVLILGVYAVERHAHASVDEGRPFGEVVNAKFRFAFLRILGIALVCQLIFLAFAVPRWSDLSAIRFLHSLYFLVETLGWGFVLFTLCLIQRRFRFDAFAPALAEIIILSGVYALLVSGAGYFAMFNYIELWQSTTEGRVGEAAGYIAYALPLGFMGGLVTFAVAQLELKSRPDEEALIVRPREQPPKAQRRLGPA